MLQQLAQDYESCLQLDLAGEEINDKSLKRDIRKIQKVLEKQFIIGYNITIEEDYHYD